LEQALLLSLPVQAEAVPKEGPHAWKQTALLTWLKITEKPSFEIFPSVATLPGHLTESLQKEDTRLSTWFPQEPILEMGIFSGLSPPSLYASYLF
jgi:hypothetical protein